MAEDPAKLQIAERLSGTPSINMDHDAGKNSYRVRLPKTRPYPVWKMPFSNQLALSQQATSFEFKERDEIVIEVSAPLVNHVEHMPKVKTDEDLHALKELLEDGSPVCTCSKVFKSKYNLLVHMKLFNEPNKLICKFCDMHYFRHCDLKYHQKKSHNYINPVKTSCCDKCQQEFPDINCLRLHQHNVHREERLASETHGLKSLNDGELFQCLCNKVFKELRCLNEHVVMSTKPSARKFKCATCGGNYPTQALLRKHSVAVHNKKIEKELGCSTCGAKFQSWRLLSQHKKQTHSTRDSSVSFQCPHCCSMYKKHHVLMKHIREFHGMRNYIGWGCNKCGAVSPTKKEASQHLKESPSCKTGNK